MKKLNITAIKNSGLDSRQTDFLFRSLEETFEEVLVLYKEEISNIQNVHPFIWMLLDDTGKELRKLFNICLNISVIKHVKNYEKILNRLKNPSEYNGALAEVYILSRIRTATENVYLISEKEIKQPDFEVKTGNFSFYVEVKGSSTTDFEVGLDMFEGWVRNRLNEMFPKNSRKKIVRFGESWIGSIAAACAIKPEIDNASWVFHSCIMSLVNQACQIISEKLKEKKSKDKKIKPDIEVFYSEARDEKDLSIIIELPQAKRVAYVRNIIQKLTDQKNFEKFDKGNGVFAFYTNSAVDKIIANQLLTTILRQCPPLRNTLLGIALFNGENNIPLFIHSINSFPKELWFPKYFKEPMWDKNICSAIIA